VTVTAVPLIVKALLSGKDFVFVTTRAHGLIEAFQIIAQDTGRQP